MQSFIESKKSLDHFDDLCKSTLLSYYISLYVTNIDTKDNHNGVSVNEIYDFLQDLQNDLNIAMPKIDKRDISLCFSILSKWGLCNCLK
jgi:E3 ubiquitin-protein ligase DOA10